MKNLKKTAAFIIIAVMMMAICSVAASAAAEMAVTFRIEAPDSNLYYGTVSVPYSGSLTVAKALEYLDEQSDELTFKGVSDGYISEVNNIPAGKFGGWDGWYFAVNNTAPDVGIGDFTLTENDSVVLYYGGYPCAIPLVDTSKLDSDGIIKFTSNDTEYDADWNPTKVVNNIKDATVTVNGTEYNTDDNGEIKILSEHLEAEMSIQIDKKDTTGAPAVLRFAPDYSVSYNGTKDTDTVTDTDVNTDSDSDTDKNTSSNNSSTNTSSTTSTTAVSRTTTTASNSTNAASVVSATATGDGRIYLAVGVFVVAIIVVAVMFLLKKKSK